MSIPELKEKLVNKIKETENKTMLECIDSFLELEEVEKIYHFTDEQKNVINEAQLQIKNGEYLTNEQANKEIDEWLNK